jgi:benzoate/toluate 1,2-dioxygenase beta subunit
MSAASFLEQVPLDEVRDFLAHEARLLDERRFGDWVALFEPDGWYWAPAQPGQESPDTALSLIYEDRRLLEVRARRLDNPSAHADTPPERSHRHLSGISARAGADGLVEAGSMLLLLAWRDGVQSCFSARCQHRLRPVAGGLRIVSKRVELLNCDAPLRRITAPF